MEGDLYALELPKITSFGELVCGDEQVMLVVPHGADPCEAQAVDLVSELVEECRCSALINSVVLREDCDLNNFNQIKKSRNSIVACFHASLEMEKCRLRQRHGRVFVICLHLSPRIYNRRRYLYAREATKNLVVKSAGERRDYDVDIGCGLALRDSEEGLSRSCTRQELLAYKYPRARDIRPTVSGVDETTLSRSLVDFTQRLFKSSSVKAVVGREWPAIKPYNLVQTVADPGEQVFAVQFEIVDDILESRHIRDALRDIINLYARWDL